MTHINLGKAVPQAYEGLSTLSDTVEKAAADAGLDPLLVELVKIRTSQLNGCAFCLRMHTRDAVARGETADRLAVIAAWWESAYFTPAEQAALTIAEQTTSVSDRRRPGYDLSALTDAQVAAVRWLTIVMNAWNRLAVESHYPVHP